MAPKPSPVFPACELHVSPTPHPSVGAAAIAVTINAAERLTSRQTWTLTADQSKPRLWFTAEPPGLVPEAVAHLDSAGVVRVGTQVMPGMVLVGRAGPVQVEETSPEERALLRLRGRPELESRSLCCPPDVMGKVVNVKRAGENRIEVAITLEQQLSIGDVLRAATGEEAVVGALVQSIPGEADIAWPNLAGKLTVQKVASAVEGLHARCIGPYSLVTQQPLAGKDNFGGQRVGLPQIRALRQAGALHALHELLTVKADDVMGRTALYTSLVKGEAPAGSVELPRAARCLELELLALGFDVDFEASRVSLRLSTDALIRQRALGAVTVPDTINEDSLQPVEGGLFCEEIFGPRESDERATRLGRCELPVPLLHPLAFEATATLLNMPREMLRKVLDGQCTLRGEPPEHWRQTGACTVREALARLDLTDVAGRPGLAGELAKTLQASKISPTSFVFETWPILPPDLRPIVPLDNGKFATSDLNDLYVQLIDATYRVERVFELNAEAIIVCSEYGRMQQALDTLVENGRWRSAGSHGRPLKSLMDLIRAPHGHFGVVINGKHVDYSAIGHVVPCEGLTPNTIRVPRSAATELFRPWVYSALERRGYVTTVRSAKKMLDRRVPEALETVEDVVRGYPVIVFPFESTQSIAPVVALDIELWDAPAFGMPLSAFELLGRPRTAVIHIPANERAVEEARKRLRTVRDAPRPLGSDGPAGWIGQAIHAGPELGEFLFAAALREDVDSIQDVDSQLLLGRRLARKD